MAKPEATIRDGSLKATIWKNDSEKGAFYSVDLVRGYKDKDDNWQETSSMTGAELLRAANILTNAYNRILHLKLDAKKETSS